jgi:hypothetical protein
MALLDDRRHIRELDAKRDLLIETYEDALAREARSKRRKAA